MCDVAEGEEQDEESEAEWRGCDTCELWWHRECLEPDVRALGDLSLIDKSISWSCPRCLDRVHRLCEVCLEQEYVLLSSDSSWIQCTNAWCLRWYHYKCLPDDVLRDIAKQSNSFLCPACGKDGR